MGMLCFWLEVNCSIHGFVHVSSESVSSFMLLNKVFKCKELVLLEPENSLFFGISFIWIDSLSWSESYSLLPDKNIGECGDLMTGDGEGVESLSEYVLNYY